MLFTSKIFLFAFLPIVLAGFFAIARVDRKAAAAWLAIASLVFYGYWSPVAVPLLLASIAFNYVMAARLLPGEPAREAWRKPLLAGAIGIDLAVLGFFKYANFFVENANAVAGAVGMTGFAPLDVLLPIGISFYTFTQIAFLVDCYQGKVRERDPVHYLLFVTYFPHLISGPVLHHAQMMPQFADRAIYRPDADKIAVGIGILVIGLAKKLLLADMFGSYADVVFTAAREGQVVAMLTAWLGVICYALQIYFDFSGYSDMAIGISLMFGVHLPVNFNSPYKATSIIDFWRRWHMTLSAFLRDYLYIPLGGNRLGRARRYVNLFVTMALAGLWHGAGWTFFLWGALHGLLLIVNHLWREWWGEGCLPGLSGRLYIAVCWLATFISVCLAWVLFRADNLASALIVYRGMLGEVVALEAGQAYIAPAVAAGLAIVLLAPNVQSSSWYVELLARARTGSVHRPLTYPVAATVVLGLLFLVCLLRTDQSSPFLYFQF